MPISGDEFDDTPHREVAEGFEGFDAKTEPQLLPAGMLQDGLNMWCQGDGYVETRPGFKLVARSGYFSGGATHPELRGMAYFDTPAYEAVALFAGDQLGLLTDVSTVVGVGSIATYGGTSFEQVPIVQMIDRLFFLRQGILHTAIRSGGGVWTVSTIITFSSGAAMPLWSKIATQGYRVFLLEANGYQLYGSAVGAAAVAADWVATENFKVGSGDGDPGRALIAGQAGFITILNAKSAWQIDPSAALVANWTSRRITGLTGCVEGRTAVSIGQDVLFLSRYGVVSLGALAQADSINPQNLISWPMQPYIDRINWTYIANAFATTWNDLYILALPLDSDQLPKYLLVYNLRTKRWMAPWKYTLPDETQFDASVTAWTGFTAACTTNFGDKAETIIGDNTGRIYRFSLTINSDEAVQGDPTLVSSYAVTRTFDHTNSQAIKQPFVLESEFNGGVAVNVQLALNRDGATIATSSGTMTDRQVGTTFNPSGSLQKFRTLARGLSSVAPYREAAIQMFANSGKLRVRRLALSAFVDQPYFTA